MPALDEDQRPNLKRIDMLGLCVSSPRRSLVQDVAESLKTGPGKRRCLSAAPANHGIPFAAAFRCSPWRVDSMGPEHKEHQMRVFDQTHATTPASRAWGKSRPPQWLLEEKFRRSILGLEDLLLGVHCAEIYRRSGLDAELANAGGGS